MARSLSVIDISPSLGLECSLCSDIHLRPKILTCSHAFCDACLARFYQCKDAPAQVHCPICGKNTRLIVVEENLPKTTNKTTTTKPPKTMPKPKPPLRTTDAEVVVTRRHCALCDPSLLTLATSVCRTCNVYICDSCTEDHALSMESHVMKRIYPKTGRSLGSASDIRYWRDELEARLGAKRAGRNLEFADPSQSRDDLEAKTSRKSINTADLSRWRDDFEARKCGERVIRSADLAKWREEFEARKQNTVNGRAKSRINGNEILNVSNVPVKTLPSGKVPVQKGSSFPPLSSTDSNWCLESVHTFHPSGREVWCMNPVEEDGMAVGYLDGGLRIYNVDGPRKTILKDVSVQGFSTLSNGLYIVRDTKNRVNIFDLEGRQAGRPFNLRPSGGFGGLGVDTRDNIYIGRWRDGRIDVLKPHGMNVIREIPCHGYEPWDICPMHRSSMLVVSGGSFVGVIDQTGRIAHEIVSRYGEDAHITVLQDDRVLIGWLRDGVMNIDLYTAELKHERSVLVGHLVNSSVSYKCCLREFASGEIALSDFECITVFRRIIPHVR